MNRRSTPHLGSAVMERYLDQDLPALEREQVLAHLDGCELCRLEVLRYQGLYASLDTLPVPEPPPGFAQQVLSAVLPHPSLEQVLMRMATRVYAVFLAVLTLVAGATVGVFGLGPLAGFAATGFSYTLGEALNSARHILVAFVDLTKTITEFLSLAKVAGSLARGLETAALALAPHYMALLGLTMVLATLVLIWALSPARERGVPHVSFSL